VRCVLPRSRTLMGGRSRHFTNLQGQYLAFIHVYTKLHGRSPAEADMQAHFKVTPPSVHRMVVALAARGLIARVRGQSRSIKILVARDELPDLE
jgi:DNA-binding MarR family transcriptional regulator